MPNTKKSRKPGPDHAGIVAQLRELIDAAGVSQAKLADAIGIAEQQLSRYFNNRSSIPVDRYFKIVDYLEERVLGEARANVRRSERRNRLGFGEVDQAPYGAANENVAAEAALERFLRIVLEAVERLRIDLKLKDSH